MLKCTIRHQQRYLFFYPASNLIMKWKQEILDQRGRLTSSHTWWCSCLHRWIFEMHSECQCQIKAEESLEWVLPNLTAHFHADLETELSSFTAVKSVQVLSGWATLSFEGFYIRPWCQDLENTEAHSNVFAKPFTDKTIHKQPFPENQVFFGAV